MRKKNTKILATISDLMCSTEFIKSLYDAGMDAVRLNTAHQDIDATRIVIENTRKVSETLGIVLDTKGPEVRTTKVESGVDLKKGDEILVCGGSEFSSKECIFVNYAHFVNDIPVNTHILIDDGLIEMKVVSKSDKNLNCKILRGGLLKSRKTVNVPAITLNLPSLSERDIAYVRFAAEVDVDFIAHSFVRNKADVLELQKLLDELNSPIKIIAKIENRAGVDNIDEILEHVYGVMVARGDLAIEIPAEEVPVVQKKIIKKCISRGRIVITATQMLHSMIESPVPTRAEVSDIANAILDGTDVVMLSGETSAGNYPVEAVQMMAKVAKHVGPEVTLFSGVSVSSMNHKISAHLAKSAVLASKEFNARAIVVGTHSGSTARIVSAYRGNVPIFAKCYSLRTARWLSLSAGVFPSVLPVVYSTDEFVSIALTSLVDSHDLTPDDLIVIVGGAGKREDAGSTFVEINSVKNALEDVS